MDFETFGEHQWADTGIFDFFRHFVHLFIASGGEFVKVSDALTSSTPKDTFDSAGPVSWADTDRDVTAWRGNSQQFDSLKKVYEIEDRILKSGDDILIEDWRKLQTSDHFYYMCTKWSNDGDVHAYFSHYKSPYTAYVNFNNAYTDIKLRLNKLNNNG
jgi:alpha-amylase